MRLSWASVAVGASTLVSNVFAYAPTDSIMDGGKSPLAWDIEDGGTC